MTLRAPAADRTVRAGIDIGGTFTDIVVTDGDGRVATRKISSTTDDYARAILNGLHELLAEEGLPPSAIAEIVHGTTVATNAVLEYKGAKTALLTTRGFRDVLELRRVRVPELYNPRYVAPRPLVERYLRFEVDERMGPDGEVIRPLDDASLDAALEKIRAQDVQAIAVCFLHSYRNPAHERAVGERIRKQFEGVFLSLSVDVLPEYREYERTSTTVINAYVGPTVKHYLGSISEQLADAGIDAPVLLMQSNGGAMSSRAAAETPAHILESGPAAGVIAALRLSERTGLGEIVTFDMGGTTAKTSMIEGGRVSQTTEYEVGAGISLSSRLAKGGGHALKLPVLDIAEVGAGGGSIVWIDRGGALRVGPQSAGAVPGPACYGLGEEPTVTDASLVLGYVNPQFLAGGEIRLLADRSRTTLMEKVARPLGIDLLPAAYGIATVAIASMVRAVKAVSTYRGRDPRDFSLLAFGGSGPIFAAQMARSLEMSRVIVPPAAGLFSAFGLLEADLEQHFSRTAFGATTEIDLASLNRTYDELEAQARENARRHYGSDIGSTFERAMDLHYAGQTTELTVPVPARPLTSSDLSALIELFGSEHQRTYGHRATDEPVEVVNLRVTSRMKRDRGPKHAWRPSHPVAQTQRVRQAYFGLAYGLLETPVVSRSDIGSSSDGPLIVDEYDATTVIPPNCKAAVDAQGNIIIEITG